MASVARLIFSRAKKLNAAGALRRGVRAIHTPPSKHAAVFGSGGMVFKQELRGGVGGVLRFHLSSAALAGDEGSDVPSAVDLSSAMPEKDFHKVSNQTLQHLQEKIEEFGEQLTIEGFDTDYAEGVLTVRFGDLGTYVINKQTPNRQVWLSSPVSGPARFDWMDGKWVYKRTKVELLDLLQKEFEKLHGKSINLSQ